MQKRSTHKLLLGIGLFLPFNAALATDGDRLSPNADDAVAIAGITSNNAFVKAKRMPSSRASEAVVTPPYTATFNKDDGLNNYTVIDANSDNKTWKYGSSMAIASYNAKLDMDDWMISQPIRLEAGNAYAFTISTHSGNASATDNYVERVEVFTGLAPTVEAMTIPVVPRTDITAKKASPQILEGTISVTASGNYYIGIHGCSEKDNWMLYINNFSISAPEVTVVPSAVTDLNVVPDPSAAFKATVSFTAPATDADGAPLTGIDRIDVKCGERLVHSFTDVTPGQACSCEDTLPEAGTYTYSVTPVIAGSEGTTLSAAVYVGIAKPKPVTNVTLTETETDGIVTLSWDAVTQNEYGFAINPDLVTYNISPASDASVIIASGVQGSSHTFRGVAEGQQTFLDYTVTAVTEAGASEPVMSPFIAAGAPYEIPMELHISQQGYPNYNFSADGDWSLAMSANDPDDDTFVFRLTPDFNKTATLGSGKVTVRNDARNPIFTFYYYTWKTPESGPSRDTLYITVNGERVEGQVYPLGASDGWMSAVFPLNAYKGSSVTVGLEIESQPLLTGMWYFPLVDGFRVIDPLDNDLMLKSVSIPTYVKAGIESEISAVVKNIGANTVTSYSVDLYRNNEKVNTAECGELTPGSSHTVRFAETPAITWAETASYHVVVNLANDDNTADNSSQPTTINVVLPDYPLATGLNATMTADNKVSLNWNAPALGDQPEQLTDDFESYEPFAIDDAGDWEFIDGDKSKTYAFGGDDRFPGALSPMAFITFDANYFPTPDDHKAHSGTKYIGSFAATSGVNDDWMISPLLPGSAQTVTLYAKSYNDKYGLETFEVLTSAIADGYTTEDFTLVRKVVAPTTWSKQTFELPEGTRRFAIHYTSEDKFFLMIDDISFTKAPDAERYSIAGYNIYRDGVKLNDTPISATEYTDNSVDMSADQYIYSVSTVYSKGESRLSEPFAFDASGIDNIEAARQASVRVVGNDIIVSGAETGSLITVCNAAGIVIGTATATEAPVSFRAAKGLYLVKAGNTAAKAIVR